MKFKYTSNSAGAVRPTCPNIHMKHVFKNGNEIKNTPNIGSWSCKNQCQYFIKAGNKTVECSFTKESERFLTVKED